MRHRTSSGTQDFYLKGLPDRADTHASVRRRMNKRRLCKQKRKTRYRWNHRFSLKTLKTLRSKTLHAGLVDENYTKDFSFWTYRLANSPYAHTCFARAHAHACTDTEITAHNKILRALYNCVCLARLLFVSRDMWSVWATRTARCRLLV